VQGTGNISILSADHSNTVYNQLPSRYRSHKASHSNFRTKIGCHGNIPQHLWIPSNTWYLWPIRATIQTTSRSFNRFCTDDHRVSLYFTMGCLFPPPKKKLPLPIGDLDSHVIHGSLGSLESSTQTAPRSVQLFLQDSLVWQTDRPRYSVVDNRHIYVRSTAMPPNN